MGTVKVISKEIREQVLLRMKNEGLTVVQAARDHGLHPKTVYNWVHRSATNLDLLELSKLKRENKELREIIGTITHELHKHKKNTHD